jgi:hypothetical protein
MLNQIRQLDLCGDVKREINAIMRGRHAQIKNS